jgi:peptidoglycan/xylan/chitin deacetylase (PgdA/CDA1 family)
MTSLRHVAGSTISSLWRTLAGEFASRAQVLMYHSVGGHADGDVRGIYSVSPERFTQQMTRLHFLCQEGHLKVVPFGSERPGTLSITFDDGYVDNYEVVLPILERFGLPFHIFLNPTLIESQQEGFLSLSNVASLKNHQLVSLGLHGYSHKPLTSLSDASVLDELERGRKWFASVTGQLPSSLSYPHGAVDDRVVDLVARCHFSVAASSKFSPILKSSERLRLPRIDIWSTDTKRSFDAKLRGHWDWMKWRT